MSSRLHALVVASDALAELIEPFVFFSQACNRHFDGPDGSSALNEQMKMKFSTFVAVMTHSCRNEKV
jgi:hypothetical protein